MSRLPVVGQDNDVWGGVLNDFLSQSLNSDGSLKNSSVASNLPDASTTTKGIVKLVGDLGGTATSPTVPGLAAREQTVNKDQINGYAGLDGNGLLKTAELPSSVVTNNQTQSAENTVLPLFTINPKTSGFEPFQVQMNSYVNPGGGAGTYNHAMFLGWNASTHGTGTPAVSGKPSLIMGMEDNYYDSGGTNLFGMEWYVEYFSPDGTSVQGLRPFYARISSDTNARNGCIITFDIGTDGTGEFLVKTQGGFSGTPTSLFAITPTEIDAYSIFYSHILTVTPALVGSSGAGQDLYMRAGTSSGSVVYLNGAANAVNLIITETGNLSIRDQAAINCFGVTGFNVAGSASQKLGFWGASPVARPTGWSAATGTATRTSFNTSSVTLPALAQAVKALIDDLNTIGVIGT